MTEYAPDFDQLLCEYSDPQAMPMPVPDPMANSTNPLNYATEAEHYPGGHLGVGQAQRTQDIQHRASAPNPTTANMQYAILGTPDGSQTRSLSFPETFQSPKGSLPSNYVPSGPDSNNAGLYGTGLTSRKRPSRSSFIEPPSARVKSPHSNTPSGANRPQPWSSTLQPTLSDEFDGSPKDFDHKSMPNQDWGASTYTSQPTISSSISPSILNPSGFPQTTSQETYIADQDRNTFNYQHRTKP